jgi:hypothetical protein
MIYEFAPIDVQRAQYIVFSKDLQLRDNCSIAEV